MSTLSTGKATTEGSRYFSKEEKQIIQPTHFSLFFRFSFYYSELIKLHFYLRTKLNFSKRSRGPLRTLSFNLFVRYKTHSLGLLRNLSVRVTSVMMTEP